MTSNAPDTMYTGLVENYKNTLTRFVGPAEKIQSFFHKKISLAVFSKHKDMFTNADKAFILIEFYSLVIVFPYAEPDIINLLRCIVSVCKSALKEDYFYFLNYKTQNALLYRGMKNDEAMNYKSAEYPS